MCCACVFVCVYVCVYVFVFVCLCVCVCVCYIYEALRASVCVCESPTLFMLLTGRFSFVLTHNVCIDWSAGCFMASVQACTIKTWSDDNKKNRASLINGVDSQEESKRLATKGVAFLHLTGFVYADLLAASKVGVGLYLCNRCCKLAGLTNAPTNWSRVHDTFQSTYVKPFKLNRNLLPSDGAGPPDIRTRSSRVNPTTPSKDGGRVRSLHVLHQQTHLLPCTNIYCLGYLVLFKTISMCHEISRPVDVHECCSLSVDGYFHSAASHTHGSRV